MHSHYIVWFPTAHQPTNLHSHSLTLFCFKALNFKLSFFHFTLFHCALKSSALPSSTTSLAMPINADPSTPPPTIGKIGPYTVFITPPPTPTAAATTPPPQPPSPIYDTPKKVVCPPAPQIHPSNLPHADGDSSVLGFLRTAVTKVQHVNSSLDDHLARWFGLNQSKYQWALDDYFETKGLDAKPKDSPKKVQNV